jgi:predicted metal-dependent hydrolase
MIMEPQDDPRFLKGIDEFNQQLFFECHETLEEIWLEEHGEDRKFYQGIIQIAAGYYKLEQGVPVGAIKLWRTGIEKVVPFGPVYLGVNVETLVGAVRANLAQLEAGQPNTTDTLVPPTINLLC